MTTQQEREMNAAYVASEAAYRRYEIACSLNRRLRRHNRWARFWRAVAHYACFPTEWS